MKKNAQSALQQFLSIKRAGALLALFSLVWIACALSARTQATVARAMMLQANIAVVSAASFEAAPVAPDAIASAFGVSLATRVEVASTLPLPTLLAGTTVKIKDSAGMERLAPLFFVSPSQINYLVPTGTASGLAAVTVTNGVSGISTGMMQIAKVAPGLFTANSTGQGVAAAVAVRVKSDGTQVFEPVVAVFDQTQQRFVARPLDLGTENEQVILVLFGTGIRGRANQADVAVRIGGVDAEVSYAGPQGDFAGLDQVNVRVPRSLLGRGRVSLVLTINGFSSSNPAELEIAGAANVQPPQINGYSAATALAGQLLTINGAGFSPNSTDNLVRIGSVEARVVSASASQLTIRVPFGAEAGVVSVRTPQGEGRGPQALQMRTSISGVVEDTRRQPISGVKVRAVGLSVEATTSAEGSFILPDMPPSLAQTVEFDGSAVPGTLPYPTVRLKLRVSGNRDNQIDAPVAMQQIIGPGVQVGGSGLTDTPLAKAASIPVQAPTQTIRTGDVVFDIPPGAAVSLPNGATSGTLNLTLVENSRTPVNLPPGLFSSTIPQITPFGAVLLPGAKLTLPNSENYAPGTQVKLFRFDQTANSPTLGEFVEAGTATVSTSGERIETAPNAITEITQYFVASPQQTTTVVGRVVDSDGAPVRQAVARCRGQEAFTDGNGGFILRGVVVNPGDLLSVEASFVRASGRVDRVQRSGIAPVAGGLTAVAPDLVLPGEDSNRPPVMLAPSLLRINEGETGELNFVAFDPDPGQTIQLNLSGASFATLINRGNDVYTLRLQTRANDAGRYTLALTAADNLGQSNRLDIALNVNRGPVANSQTVVTDEDVPRPITLTGGDPDGDPLSFVIVTNLLHGRLSGAPPNLSYTPDPRYTGTDSFTFKVNDGLADSAPATVSIAINPVNHRPALTVPLAQTVNEGQELSFTVTASDIDVGQTLSFTATNLPGGASFTPTSGTTARFVWTPTFTQAGSYTVSFRVADNGVPALNDTKTVAITVRDVNRAPMLTVPVAQTVASGQNISFTVSATDPDIGQIVVLSAEDLPPGATFNPTNGLFSWTPNAPQAGAHAVTFKATDNGSPVLSTTAGVAVMVTIQWKPTAAIEGGEVPAMVSNGPSVFAGTFGGVYRSTDDGQSWVAVNTGLTNLEVRAFAVVGTTLFAGTHGGVFRSTDNGSSWVSANSGIDDQSISAMAVSGTTLFAGSGSIYRSTDNGQSWNAVNTGLPSSPRDIRSFAVSGANIFAGTDGKGIFLSTDNGQSWAAMNNGLPPNGFYHTLAISGSRIYAGTFDSGLFVSTNNGQNWTAVTNLSILSGFINAIFVADTRLWVSTLAGVFLSVNNGQSWTFETNFPASASFVVHHSSLFAGSYDGVYRSTDNGQNFALSSNGLTVTSSAALAVSGAHLFATFGDNQLGGIYRSSDNGQNWGSVNSFPTGRAIALSLIVNGANIIAGEVGGVYLSSDDGQSWQGGTGLPPEGYSYALAISGTDFFTGLSRSTNGGVYRSTNNGQNWVPANAGIENLFVHALAVSGTTLFAGSNTNGKGIYRSTDNGQSWVAVNTGLTDLGVQSLFVSGTNIFAGTFSGIYRSTNNGNSWVNMTNGLPAGTAVNAFAQSGSSIFAATYNGVFASTNRGQSWTAVSTGLPPTGALAIAVSSTRLFVGLRGKGVYVAQ